MRLLTNIQHFDFRLLLWCMHSRHHRKLAQIGRYVSKTGDGHVQVILPITMFAASTTLEVDFLYTVIACFLLERSVYWVLKNSCKRKRPPNAIPSFESVITASDEFSFPSGHTSAAFALVALLILLGYSWAVLLYPWAILVGMSRVVLGVHFPSDIVAGAILGTSLALIGVSTFTF